MTMVRFELTEEETAIAVRSVELFFRVAHESRAYDAYKIAGLAKTLRCEAKQQGFDADTYFDEKVSIHGHGGEDCGKKT